MTKSDVRDCSVKLLESLASTILKAAENEEAFGLELRSYQLNTDDAQHIAVKYCKYRIVSISSDTQYHL